MRRWDLAQHNPRLFWGGLLVGFIVLLSFGGPLIVNENPMSMDLSQRLLFSSWEHPFGTDEFGADILLKILHGAKLSLTIAFWVILFSALVGGLLGMVSGYLGGYVDLALMRFIDVFYAIPNFLICLAILSALPPSTENLILALSLTGWVSYARLVRGEVLMLKEKEFIHSAFALGASPLRVLFRHIAPSLTPPLIVHSIFALAGIIITESGLSFLGLGVGAEQASWGSLLYSGKQFLAVAPHLTLFPAVAICLTVFGMQLVGDGLQYHFDPRKEKTS